VRINSERLLKISVVTPSYNQGNFLEATIRSVLEQGYPNLEYIIIDGGSCDDSVEIIKRYADRLTYWCSEPDGGQPQALNKGFARATGDILCWVNSDDLLVPDSLRLIAEYFMQNPDIYWLTGGCEIIDADGTVIAQPFIDAGLPLSEWLLHMKYRRAAILQPSTFWRKNVWDHVGVLCEQLQFVFDFEFFYRIRKRYGVPAQLDPVLSQFRVHGDSKTVSQEEMFLLEMIDTVRAEVGFLSSESRGSVDEWLRENRGMECFFRQQLAIKQGKRLVHWKWRFRGWLNRLLCA